MWAQTPFENSSKSLKFDNIISISLQCLFLNFTLTFLPQDSIVSQICIVVFNFVNNCFFKVLSEHLRELSDDVLLWNCASPYCNAITQEYLNFKYLNNWIERTVAAMLSRFKSWWFFVWGCIKHKVYATLINTVELSRLQVKIAAWNDLRHDWCFRKGQES